jgi:hypothetical protein
MGTDAGQRRQTGEGRQAGRHGKPRQAGRQNKGERQGKSGPHAVRQGRQGKVGSTRQAGRHAGLSIPAGKLRQFGEGKAARQNKSRQAGRREIGGQACKACRQVMARHEGKAYRHTGQESLARQGRESGQGTQTGQGR